MMRKVLVNGEEKWICLHCEVKLAGNLEVAFEPLPELAERRCDVCGSDGIDDEDTAYRNPAFAN